MLNQETKDFIKSHFLDDVRQLALQSKSFVDSPIDFQEALIQISGRQMIEHKIPSWYKLENIIYPSRLSIEQSSSELTAKYKASIVSGSTLVDLTGGWGVDTAFMSEHFFQAIHIEQQEKLSAIAGHNFQVLGYDHIQTYTMDGECYLKEVSLVDCIYIDPARRSDSGKKQIRIEDCEPNLIHIQDLLIDKTHQVLIKLSPMLDINAALGILKSVWAIHVVSVENECKELLFLLSKEHNVEEPVITAVNLNRNGKHQLLSFSLLEEKKIEITYTSNIETYLYEPNASLLKSGYYKGIARYYQLNKLHADSHLYTSSQYFPDFQGRTFRVDAVYSMSKKEVSSLLKEITQANISTRNFPLSVAELRKKLKLKEGGENFLFATTLANGKHVLIKCRKIGWKQTS